MTAHRAKALTTKPTPHRAPNAVSAVLADPRASTPQGRWSIEILSFSGALLAAAIAGCVAVAIVYITAAEQRKLEVEKFDWQKRDAVFKSSIDLASRVAAALYEIGSFLESVDYHPDKLDQLYDLHETRMKELMPPVVAAHVSVAAYDYDLFKRFIPLVEDISHFDACLTQIYRRMSGRDRLSALVGLKVSQGRLLSELSARVHKVAAGEETVALRMSFCGKPNQ